MSDSQNLAQQIADAIEQLPPVPDHIDRLFDAVKNHDAKSHHITGMIRNDPGLCADLLHLSNDPSYGQPQKTDTIEEALGLVDTDTLLEMVCAVYANRVMTHTCSSMVHLNEYFEHSKDIARASTALAQTVGLTAHRRQTFSVLGLIHDMGRLMMMLVADPDSASLMGTPCRLFDTIVCDENDIWGLNHCDVGMRLCKKWRFTPVLEQGVLRHHTPLIDDDFSFAGAVVFVAHFLACSDMTGDIVSRQLPDELLDRIPMTARQFDQAKEHYQKCLA